MKRYIRSTIYNKMPDKDRRRFFNKLIGKPVWLRNVTIYPSFRNTLDGILVWLKIHDYNEEYDTYNVTAVYIRSGIYSTILHKEWLAASKIQIPNQLDVYTDEEFNEEYRHI